MRPNTVIILAAVTIPLALVALFVPSGGGSSVKSALDVEVFPGLKDWIGQTSKMTITTSAGTVTLTRKIGDDNKGQSAAAAAEGWVVASKSGYPADPGKVREVLTGLVALREIEGKTEQPKLYRRIDLADPGKGSDSREIELSKTDGASILKLIVGKHKYDPLAQGNDGIYIRKPDDPHTWLARPAFEPAIDDIAWLNRKILDLDAATLHRVVLTPAGGKPLEFDRDTKGGPLVVKDFPKDAKPKQQNPAQNVEDLLHYLSLDDVKPAAQLDSPAVATAHFDTFDGLSGDLTLYKKDGAWVTVAVKGGGDAVKAADEITKRTAGWAYKVPDAKGAAIETKLSDVIEEPEKPDTDEKAGPLARPPVPKAKTVAPK
jgi:hypothetical protein